MNGPSIFGTDGIRGRAGEGWLSPGAVAQLGRAAGEALAHDTPALALLGHDGRQSGPTLEAALGAGLTEAGFDVRSAGLITTPGLAWLVQSGAFCMGAMVSASHNPAEDNGIKLLGADGGKLSDGDQLAIEARLTPAPAQSGAAGQTATCELVVDESLERAYVDHLVSNEGHELQFDGMQLVIDCANGAGSRVAPQVFRRLGAEVTAISCAPDGENINANCGSTHPAMLQEVVREHGADLGVALDGDGDRCIMVDEHGALVHGDGIMTVIGRHAVKVGELQDNRVVATVMSNRGLHRALREVGVTVLEVPVGDRAVVDAMRRERLSLGGEQSGHIVLGPKHGFIGDGILTALRVIRAIREQGETLSTLAAPYQPFPQVLLNVRVQRKPDLGQLPAVTAAVRDAEQALGRDGRVLLRYSGTEDLARVMVEGPSEEVITGHAEALAELIDSELNS